MRIKRNKTARRSAVAGFLAMVIAGSTLAAVSSPAAAAPLEDPTTLSTTPDMIWDVDDRSGTSLHTGVYQTLVWDFLQHDGVMYVGGDFTTVVAPDGTRTPHGFLAAFDIDTGEWIPEFAPQLDQVVYSLDITDDGHIVAGGEFSGGVALIDPASGEMVDGFEIDLAHYWGRAAVFTVNASGDDIYAGGRFVRGQGLVLDNLAKLDARSGVIDPAWMPSVQSVEFGGVLSERVYDIEVDPGRGRVYVGGLFASVNESPETDAFAVLSDATGATLLDHPNVSYDNRPISFLYDITLADELVHYGGKENFSITVDADTFTRDGQIRYTNNGDHQVIHDGITTLWIGCHCWRYAFTADPPQNPFLPTDNAIRVNAVFGIDKATGEMVPMTFDLRGAAGAWAIEEDPNGRLWVGGQFTQGGGRRLTGIARFSPKAGDEVAVTACTATRTGTDVNVSWEADVDPDAFVIRRAVDGRAPFHRGRTDGEARTFVDSDRSGSIVYTVESRDGRDIVGDPVACENLVGEGPPPTGLEATRTTRERVVLRWTNDGRSVEIARDGEVIASDNDGWYTDLTVESGTTYEFQIRHEGDQTWSAPLTVVTL